MNVYLEKLDLLSILHIIEIYFFKKINIVYLFSNKNKFYFFLFKVLSRFLNLKYSKIAIDFNQYKINNECLYSYVYSQLNFEFEKGIEKNKLFNLNKKNYYLSNYIKKKFSMGHFIMNIKNPPYTLMFILKILIDKKKYNNYLILTNRPLENEYKKIFYNYNCEIFFVKNYFLFLNIFNYPSLINIFVKINFFINKLFFSKKNNNNQYFIINDDTISDNLEKNGFINDFAFQSFSSLNLKYIIFRSAKNLKDLNIFNKVKNVNLFEKLTLSFYPNSDFHNNFSFSTDKNYYNKILTKYLFFKNQWLKFFIKNNIKIYLTWYKYWPENIIINEAINEFNGISCIWQRSFESFDNVDNKIITDIYFSNSIEHSKTHKKTNNFIKSEVCVGVLHSYNLEYVKLKAYQIKRKLNNSGAETIIGLFDQNSNDEYGHNLQRESYLFLLDQILKNPKLGLILKPKKINTLYNRLGSEIKILIKKAIDTGRCHLFDSFSKTQSNTLISLAALASDINIGTNLKAGTTAIESAILDKRTLLLDREGYPKSCFYNDNFNSENIVFNNWNDLLKELSNFIKSNNKNDRFGNWKNHISYFDPYRDGNSQARMGDYLNDLITNINLGIHKEECIDIANNKFIQKWGKDKIYLR